MRLKSLASAEAYPDHRLSRNLHRCLKNPGPDLGRSVLITVHSVQGVLRGVGDILGRVIPTISCQLDLLRRKSANDELNVRDLQKALAHIDNRLYRRISCGLVDDGPGTHNVN